MDGLKLELKVKSRAVDDVAAEKQKLEDELHKLKDQNTQLQSSLSQVDKDKEEAVKATNEEVEMHAVEVVEEMKNRHDDKLMKSHEEGWNSAADACGSQMKRLKDHLYRAGYEHGLNLAVVSDDSELFDGTILCPPDALIGFDPNADEEEDDDEGKEDGDEGAANGGDNWLGSSLFTFLVFNFCNQLGLEAPLL